MESILSRGIYRAVAILTLNAIIVFACFELFAMSISKVKTLSATSKPTEQLELVGEGKARETVSYYATQDWAKRNWHEFRLARKQQFYPYVDWRRAPFKGQTIEVDQNGVRLTPGADCSAKSFKVFTFGASEMWGTGSPNWGTIPAHLQKGLEKLRPGPVCVTNYAESAHVSMQNVIMLLTQLRSGNVPDVVVFYALADDIYSAYQSGRPGVIENLSQIAARFEGRKEAPTVTFVDRLRGTYSYALIDQLMGKLTIAKPQQEDEPTAGKLVTYESMGVDVATLSDLIARDYFGGYKIVNSLAKEYGFKYFYFVPPTITRGDKPLTPEEQDMKRIEESQTAHHKLSTSVYDIVERESSKYQHLYSMVHVFDPYDSLMWIDGGHATPVGNQVIAEKMLAVIQAQSSDKK
jgi:lysophospholipase L1-like esterase